MFVHVCRSRFQSSTKIEALREELELMRRRDPSAKAIVFSQFTSMLELIGFRLEQVSGDGWGSGGGPPVASDSVLLCNTTRGATNEHSVKFIHV